MHVTSESISTYCGSEYVHQTFIHSADDPFTRIAQIKDIVIAIWVLQNSPSIFLTISDSI